ncbi:MAG: hypothetical protein V7707_14480 [Motiliproteus sp.]
MYQNIDSGLDLQTQLDELYRQAELADRKLGKFMSEVIKKFPGVAGAASHAPLKKRRAAELKVTQRGKKVNQLKDIARATIEFRVSKDMFAAREYIRNSSYFQEIKDFGGALKDRYTGNPTPQGYRDVKFFLLMPIGGGQDHLVELQLNIKHAMMAKKTAHSFYELLRQGGAGWNPEKRDSKIVVQKDDVPELALKLRHDWVACKASGTYSQEVLSRVGEVLTTKFFDHHGEPRQEKVILKNLTSKEQKASRALSKLCCDIYDYYNKLSQNQLTVPAAQMHRS